MFQPYFIVKSGWMICLIFDFKRKWIIFQRYFILKVDELYFKGISLLKVDEWYV